MPSFADFENELEGDLKDLIEKSWKSLADAATADAKDFLAESEADLRRWTGLLAQRSLTLQDFEFLLAAKKDVAELVALKQAGLAQIQLDRFINGVVGAIIDAASKVFT